MIRSQRSLYGTSLLGAGAVHHIKPGLPPWRPHVLVPPAADMPPHWLWAAIAISCREQCSNLPGQTADYSITSSARASSDGRHVDAERRGGFQIDDELELGRGLHRQVGRFLAVQDAVDVGGRASVQVDQVGPIRHEATGLDEEAIGVDRRQPMPGRERDDALTLDRGSGADTTIRPPSGPLANSDTMASVSLRRLDRGGSARRRAVMPRPRSRPIVRCRRHR